MFLTENWPAQLLEEEALAHPRPAKTGRGDDEKRMLKGLKSLNKEAAQPKQPKDPSVLTVLPGGGGPASSGDSSEGDGSDAGSDVVVPPEDVARSPLAKCLGGARLVSSTFILGTSIHVLGVGGQRGGERPIRLPTRLLACPAARPPVCPPAQLLARPPARPPTR